MNPLPICVTKTRHVHVPVCTVWAFNPLSLLSILNAAVLPESFRIVKIDEFGETCWLRTAFNKAVQEKYAESGFKVKFDFVFDSEVGRETTAVLIAV